MKQKNRLAKVLLIVVIGLALLASFINVGTSSAQAAADSQAGRGSPPPLPPAVFIKGFDASYVSRVEAKGGVYKTAGGVTQDVFKILAANGVNYVRFRLWNDPAEGYCNKADVLALALRARAAGLKILINFHYSDSWADPGKQTKPAAWSGLTFDQLAQAVHDYSYDVVNSLIAQGTPPDMVEVGNEIIHGMLWPDGFVARGDAAYDTSAAWSRLATLINSAMEGVRDTGSKARFMIHTASGDESELLWFYDNLIASGVDFDYIGLSYYYLWHGSLDTFSMFLSDIALRYKKPVIIAETAYPFTLGWNDWTNNIIGLESQLAPGFPATEAGQAAWLQAVVAMTQAIPKNKGAGVFYWGGEWIATSPQDPNGSTWENQAMFNFDSKAISAFSVFKNTR